MFWLHTLIRWFIFPYLGYHFPATVPDVRLPPFSQSTFEPILHFHKNVGHILEENILLLSKAKPSSYIKGKVIKSWHNSIFVSKFTLLENHSVAFQWFICEGNLIVYHGFRNNRESYFHQHWLSSNCRDERLLPHPLKLEMEQRLWVPNSVCTSRCYCFAFIHIKVSFKTTQSMCELCWRLLLFSCMLGAIKCNNSIKNRHGEKILSFATSTEKWKWEKSYKKGKLSCRDQDSNLGYCGHNAGS